MKRFISLFLALALLSLALSGCWQEKVAEGLPTAPITVEHDATWWWQNYLALMVYPLQRAYPAPGTLADEEFRLTYCLLQGAKAGDIPPVESENENRRMTVEQYAAYSLRYFGVELPEDYPLTQMTTQPEGWVGGDINENVFPEDGATGDWAFEVLSATPVENNRVEVLVGRKNTDAPGEYDMTNTFTFAHSGNDEYRLERKTEVYNEDYSPTPVFTGDVTVTQWTENVNALFHSTPIGIIGDTLYLGELSQTFSLYRLQGYDLKTGAARYRCDVPLGDPYGFYGAGERGETLTVSTSGGIYTYAPDLTLLSTQGVSKPQAISPDGNYRAYVDETGIQLEEGASTTPRLLASHPVPPGDMYGMGGLTYGAPSFTADGRYLVATLYGYESVEGAFVYNLETGAIYDDRDGYGWYSGYAGIWGDWFVKFLPYEGEWDGQTQMEIVNLVTGEKKSPPLPPTNSSVDPSLWLSPIKTEKGLCFYTSNGAYRSTEPVELCLLDPEAGTVEMLDFSLTYGSMEFLGEREGRLLFLYRRNVGGPVLGIASVGL